MLPLVDKRHNITKLRHMLCELKERQSTPTTLMNEQRLEECKWSIKFLEGMIKNLEIQIYS